MKPWISIILSVLLLTGCVMPAVTPAATEPAKPALPEVQAEDAANEQSAKEQAAGDEAAGTAELRFSSFDGGGHEYKVEIEDPSILTYSAERDYGKNHDELETGSPFHMIFTFTGLKPGTTTVTVYGRSPIMENEDSVYTAVVDDSLDVTLQSVRQISTLFYYRSGDIDYDTYDISRETDGYHVSVNDGEEQIIETNSVNELMSIIEHYDVVLWDGFAETERGVRDGETFWLEVRLTDGTYIEAKGENAYPENYFLAMNSMQQVLSNAVITPLMEMDPQE